MTIHIRIATRRSPLALWQAEHVAAELARLHPGQVTTELVKIETKGDKILDVPLAKVGGKGLFTKEIDMALFDGRADIARSLRRSRHLRIRRRRRFAFLAHRQSPS